MSGCQAVAVRQIIQRLPEVLPRDGRGLSVAEVHKAIDLWAPGTVRTALDVFEGRGGAVSVVAPGIRRMPTRYYRLIDNREAGAR